MALEWALQPYLKAFDVQAKIILFCKVTEPSAGSKIYFALTEGGLLHFDLAQHTPELFVQKNNLTRHETFDWYTNRFREKFFLCEHLLKEQEALPAFVTNVTGKEELISWQPFPVASKKLTAGKERNMLQLAVQYLASGRIDESVIAADYDSQFLEFLTSQKDRS